MRSALVLPSRILRFIILKWYLFDASPDQTAERAAQIFSATFAGLSAPSAPFFPASRASRSVKRRAARAAARGR